MSDFLLTASDQEKCYAAGEMAPLFSASETTAFSRLLQVHGGMLEG
jgi:hypothetical protein